jgi:hypothetical protein
VSLVCGKRVFKIYLRAKEKAVFYALKLYCTVVLVLVLVSFLEYKSVPTKHKLKQETDKTKRQKDASNKCLVPQPPVEEEEAYVTGNETCAGDIGTIFQKAKTELFTAPEADKPFNTSNPAMQSNPITV